MVKPLEFDIGGIKCDNPSCNYQDTTVKVEDYDKWLNKPCPHCSSNLLTEADYKNIQIMLQQVTIINQMSPEELKEFACDSEDDEIVQMNIGMDGTGKVTFELEK